MSLRRLTAYVILFQLIGLGVFFAYLLAFAVTQGGVITLNMTLFGEMYLEYMIMLIIAAVGPYALWVLDQQVINK